MSWHILLDNPIAIEELFDQIPSLDAVELTKLEIKQGDPPLVISVLLDAIADRPPRRWPKNASEVHMEFEIYEIESLRICGWSQQSVRKPLMLSGRAGAIRVGFEAGGNTLDLQCGVIRVGRITGLLAN